VSFEPHQVLVDGRGTVPCVAVFFAHPEDNALPPGECVPAAGGHGLSVAERWGKDSAYICVCTPRSHCRLITCVSNRAEGEVATGSPQLSKFPCYAARPGAIGQDLKEGTD
jgi:hypothetical protein